MISSEVSVARVTAQTTVLTAAGFIVALIAQVIYARVLGVGSDTDALALALAWTLTASGIVATPLVSVLVSSFIRDQALLHSESAVGPIGVTIALAIGMTLTALTGLGAAPLADVLGPGSDIAGRVLLERLLVLVAPLCLIWTLVACLTGVLNAFQRHRLAAASTLIQPAVVGTILTLGPASVEIAAVGYVAGATLQLVVVFVALRGVWRQLRPTMAGGSSAVFGRLVTVGSAFLLFNAMTLVARAAASLGGVGDVAVLDYSTRLINAFEQVTLAGAAAVLFTAWAVDAANESSRPRLSIGGTLRPALGMLTISAAILAVVAEPLVSVLFGGGSFGPRDVQAVAAFLVLMTPGLAAHAIILLLVRAMLARLADRHLLGTAVVTFATFTMGVLTLRPILGLSAVAVSYSLAWISGAVIASIQVSKVLSEPLMLGAEVARSLAASAAAVLAGFVGLQIVPPVTPLQIVVAASAGTTAAILVGHAIRLSSVTSLETRLARRLAQR